VNPTHSFRSTGVTSSSASAANAGMMVVPATRAILLALAIIFLVASVAKDALATTAVRRALTGALARTVSAVVLTTANMFVCVCVCRRERGVGWGTLGFHQDQSSSPLRLDGNG
jgi:hypothetical protein